MYSMMQQKGFAVLTSAVLLSLAGIVFTANMASTQLVDNQVIGNYYRNNEAFVNAESGVHLVLSKLDDPVLAKEMLENLPFQSPTGGLYIVSAKTIAINRLEIISSGTSTDGTALREIRLEVDFLALYPLPDAPISAYKLNLDPGVLVDSGCELDPDNCLAEGNSSENTVASYPDAETAETDPCTGGALKENIFATGYGGTFHEGAEIRENGILKIYQNGGFVTAPDDDEEYVEAPASIFEEIFGQPYAESNFDAESVVNINGKFCSQELSNLVTDDTEVVIIDGDCEIEQSYTEKSVSSENKVLTIGSADHPKFVIIEGGTFITAPNTGASVVGMLYFLPQEDLINEDGNLVNESGQLVDEDGVVLAEGADPVQSENLSIDMGGVNVNGAMLSDYKCSHDGYDQSDSKETKQHFSARFDKLALTELYKQIEIISSTGSVYRIAQGTWRDF